ncbi:hypothetical protein B0H17DRAFT_1132627 [Mycena rosella]|uniref:Uncharacterized protein n=1 Tax=Mycena rosella TaxID=1033263 RepID=A0AAD7GJ30_MYCRO|nr:hypothetical protein B0H17DRAFT_1132627 [Mycena rosella]
MNDMRHLARMPPHGASIRRPLRRRRRRNPAVMHGARPFHPARALILAALTYRDPPGYAPHVAFSASTLRMWCRLGAPVPSSSKCVPEPDLAPPASADAQFAQSYAVSGLYSLWRPEFTREHRQKPMFASSIPDMRLRHVLNGPGASTAVSPRSASSAGQRSRSAVLGVIRTVVSHDLAGHYLMEDDCRCGCLVDTPPQIVMSIASVDASSRRDLERSFGAT